MIIRHPTKGSITLRNPILRDQTTDHIATTFVRFENGSISSYRHNSPVQKTVQLVFDALSYKKARELIAFLKATDGEVLTFEGIAEFTEIGGEIKATVVSDPIPMITTGPCTRQIPITISLQETIALQGKHIGQPEGSQIGVPGLYGSFYLISGESASAKLGYNTEYARFVDTPGYWTSRTPIPIPDRTNSAGFEIEGIIYLVGGHDGSTRLNLMHSYVPAYNGGGVWHVHPQSPLANLREQHVAFAIGAIGYVVGGRIGSAIVDSNTMEKYENGSWAINTDAPYPVIIRNSSAFVQFAYDEEYNPISVKAYAFGGSTPYNNDTYIYDPVTNTWSLWGVSVLPTRENHASAADLDNGFVFGGENGGGVQNNNYKFNVEANTWTSASANLPVATKNHSGCGLEEAIYSVSGYTTSIVDKNYEFIDGISAWVQRADVLVTDQVLANRMNSVAVASYLGGTPRPEAFQDLEVIDPVPSSYVILCGGNTHNTAPKLQGFNPITTTWTWDFGSFTLQTSMPFSLAHHKMATIGQVGYVVDGSHALHRAFPALYKFDETLTWTSLDNQPKIGKPRDITYNHGVVSFEGYVYKYGGLFAGATTLDNFSQQVQRWSELSGWEVVVDSFLLNSDRRSDFGCATKDEDMYIIGGVGKVFTNDPIGRIGNTTVYNFITKSIKKKGYLPGNPFTRNSSSMGVVNINGELYSFTAEIGYGSLEKRTLQWDEGTDVWVNHVPVTPQPATHASYAATNTSNVDVGAIFGGQSADGTKNDASFVYDVTTKVWTIDASTGTPASYMAAACTQVIINPTSTKDMLIIDGLGGSSVTERGSTFKHDTSSNVFTLLNPPPAAGVVFGTARNCASKVYLFGIPNSLNSYAELNILPPGGIQAFDPALLVGSNINGWITDAEYPLMDPIAPTRFMASAVVDNKVILFSGITFANTVVPITTDETIFRLLTTGVIGTAIFQSLGFLDDGSTEKVRVNQRLWEYDPLYSVVGQLRPGLQEVGIRPREIESVNWMARGASYNGICYFIRSYINRDMFTYDSTLGINTGLGSISGYIAQEDGVFSTDEVNGELYKVGDGNPRKYNIGLDTWSTINTNYHKNKGATGDLIDGVVYIYSGMVQKGTKVYAGVTDADLRSFSFAEQTRILAEFPYNDVFDELGYYKYAYSSIMTDDVYNYDLTSQAYYMTGKIKVKNQIAQGVVTVATGRQSATL